MSSPWRILVLALGLFLAGCVTSKTPLLGPDSRVLPFLPGAKFETYERDDARAPWKKNDNLSVFTADQSLTIREQDKDGHYAYGVLDIRNSEGVITGFGCKGIDQAAFRRQGGKIVKEVCELDGAP